MSRIKRFTHSILTSYALMGINVLYTLASVPLALKYLSKPEFGLWALTLQVANYLAMVALGMGSSIARFLIDHKDERQTGRYGGMIKSGFLVGLVQGMLVLLAGLSLVWFMGAWLKVPSNLSRDFLWLMIGQALLTAVAFMTRIPGQILYAWQRIDINNYAAMLQFLVGFAVLWIGFARGWGVFSLLAGAVANWACGTTICFLACRRLGFWPKSGEWGPASRQHFRELFNYGADLFMMVIGTQLIMSSQTLLVSRQLGMEAAALWSVMTKVFSMVSQVVWRIISNAMPVFAEMYARNEQERLWDRYRKLFTITSVLAGACGVLFAACNGPFVSVWMQGQFSWPGINNVLLGAWLVALTQQCCHNSLVACLKQIRNLKYVYLLEGLVFVGIALAILPASGMTGMLVCSLAATILFTWLIGSWRVAQLLGGHLKPLLWDWQLPLIRILAGMVPCWFAVNWILGSAPNWLRLAVNGVLLVAVGVWVSIRFALPRQLTNELVTKLPGPMQAPVSRLTRYGHEREYRGA